MPFKFPTLDKTIKVQPLYPQRNIPDPVDEPVPVWYALATAAQSYAYNWEDNDFRIVDSSSLNQYVAFSYDAALNNLWAVKGQSVGLFSAPVCTIFPIGEDGSLGTGVDYFAPFPPNYAGWRSGDKAFPGLDESFDIGVHNNYVVIADDNTPLSSANDFRQLRAWKFDRGDLFNDPTWTEVDIFDGMQLTAGFGGGAPSNVGDVSFDLSYDKIVYVNRTSGSRVLRIGSGVEYADDAITFNGTYEQYNNFNGAIALWTKSPTDIHLAGAIPAGDNINIFSVDLDNTSGIQDPFNSEDFDTYRTYREPVDISNNQYYSFVLVDWNEIPVADDDTLPVITLEPLKLTPTAFSVTKAVPSYETQGDPNVSTIRTTVYQNPVRRLQATLHKPQDILLMGRVSWFFDYEGVRYFIEELANTDEHPDLFDASFSFMFLENFTVANPETN